MFRARPDPDRDFLHLVRAVGESAKFVDLICRSKPTDQSARLFFDSRFIEYRDNYFVRMIVAETQQEAEAKADALRPKPKLPLS
jgi:hypothetical protein